MPVLYSVEKSHMTDQNLLTKDCLREFGPLIVGKAFAQYAKCLWFHSWPAHVFTQFWNFSVCMILLSMSLIEVKIKIIKSVL